MVTLPAGGIREPGVVFSEAFTKGAKGAVSSASTVPYVRVNGSASNPAGGQAAPSDGGPSRGGGLTTKIHALVDGKGRVMRLIL